MCSTVDEMMRQVDQIDGGESRSRRCLTLVRRRRGPASASATTTATTASNAVAASRLAAAEESKSGQQGGVGGGEEIVGSQAEARIEAGDQRKVWGLNGLPAPWSGGVSFGGGGFGGGGFGGGGGGGGFGGGPRKDSPRAPENGVGDGVDLILDDFSITSHGADEQIPLAVVLEAPSGERRSIEVTSHAPTDDLYAIAKEFTGLADGFSLQHYYTRLLSGAGTTLGEHGVESGDVIKVQLPMMAGMFHVSSGIAPGGGLAPAQAGVPLVTVELYDDYGDGTGRVRGGKVSVVGSETTVADAVAMIERGGDSEGERKCEEPGEGEKGKLDESLLAAIDQLGGEQREELIRKLLGVRRGGGD